jgi:hypothetical protein
MRVAQRNTMTKPARSRLAPVAAHFFLPARIFYPVRFAFDGINGLFSTISFGHLIATISNE